MRDTKYGIRVYMQPAFLICTAVLAMSGSGMAIAIKSFGVYLKKEPLPLKMNAYASQDLERGIILGGLEIGMGVKNGYGFLRSLDRVSPLIAGMRSLEIRIFSEGMFMMERKICQ